MMHLLRSKLLSDSSSRKSTMERQKLIRRVGKRGKYKGQFMGPSGVAVSKSGNYLFYVELIFLRTITFSSCLVTNQGSGVNTHCLSIGQMFGDCITSTKL